MNTINGIVLRDALISASNHLTNHRKEIDSLNIFPVPDGDTGTNMSMTMQSAAAALQSVYSEDVSEIAQIATSALLRGAKGNSGVILSILFKGFTKNIAGLKDISGVNLVSAMGVGVEMAYDAVMAPTEGTILTVARKAQEAGREALSINNGALHVWEAICKGAEKALQTTPELLHVLKRAGVVDAGGKGLCLILEGMRSVFAEGVIIERIDDGAQPAVPAPSAQHIGDDAFRQAAAAYDNDTKFTYCTECIIGRSGEKTAETLRTYLTTIGDCVVVVDDDSIIKVHVHTDDPGKVLQTALDYGALLTVKVDNMREQAKALTAGTADDFVPAEPTEDFGFVAVAAGDGIQAMFYDLGCKQVVNGGQSMNPSTEDIARAILTTPAKVVYVLPNNKNILMAAEQAVSLVEDRKVVIVPTRTIPQGMSAMMAFSSTRSPENNQGIMMDAARHVKTGSVTFAARDSKFGSTKIRTGDILGLINGKLDLVEKEHDPVHTAIRLGRSMITRDTSFVTILYGADITETQAAEVYEKLKAKAGKQVEINLVNGGQPIYYFLLSVE